jgi:iron(III) transport system ATP-binding protein
VFVTHDQEEALAIADVVAVMRDGRVVQVGSPTEVYRAPSDPWTARFLGDSVILDGTVVAGTVETQVGSFATTSIEPGPVELMLRPEWIRPVPDPAGDATVIDREFFGHDQMVLIELECGARIQSRIGPRPDLTRGDRVHLEFDEWVVYPRPGAALRRA